MDLYPTYPLTDADEDTDAARLLDGSRNRWFLDPLFGRGYPSDMLEHYERILPKVDDGDLETIAAPLDFLGVNYYSRAVVRAGSDPARPIAVDLPDAERTQMGWEVYPDGLKDLLVRLHGDYELPDVYITENGAAYPDARTNGSVADPQRISYVERHVAALRDAIAQGVPVRGYFLWSLLDNFEWAYGFSRRFGIVYVDFDTLERVPKDSFKWYRDLIAALAGPNEILTSTTVRDLVVGSGIEFADRGTHVLKALSLGAKAVGLGRYYLFPLAAAGQAGVERALELMRTELERDMKLMGCASIAQLSRENLRFH